jgi:CBS domain containing-hemolysin-like protein
VAGLVTIEDLLEEIVGEIQDEYDFEEPVSRRLSDYEVIFDARVDLDDVNREMGLELPTDESDTLGGLIYAKLGRMPTKGDEVRLDGVRLVVLSMKGHRIGQVKIVKEVPPSPGGAEVSLGRARTVDQDGSETERNTDAWARNYQPG